MRFFFRAVARHLKQVRDDRRTAEFADALDGVHERLPLGRFLLNADNEKMSV